jgi:hypothetical protein
MIQYNVAGGKMNRGLTVLDVQQTFAKVQGRPLSNKVRLLLTCFHPFSLTCDFANLIVVASNPNSGEACLNSFLCFADQLCFCYDRRDANLQHWAGVLNSSRPFS